MGWWGCLPVGEKEGGVRGWGLRRHAAGMWAGIEGGRPGGGGGSGRGRGRRRALLARGKTSESARAPKQRGGKRNDGTHQHAHAPRHGERQRVPRRGHGARDRVGPDQLLQLGARAGLPAGRRALLLRGREDDLREHVRLGDHMADARRHQRGRRARGALLLDVQGVLDAVQARGEAQQDDAAPRRARVDARQRGQHAADRARVVIGRAAGRGHRKGRPAARARRDDHGARRRAARRGGGGRGGGVGRGAAVRGVDGAAQRRGARAAGGWLHHGCLRGNRGGGRGEGEVVGACESLVRRKGGWYTRGGGATGVAEVFSAWRRWPWFFWAGGEGGGGGRGGQKGVCSRSLRRYCSL